MTNQDPYFLQAFENYIARVYPAGIEPNQYTHISRAFFIGVVECGTYMHECVNAELVELADTFDLPPRPKDNHEP